MKEKLNFIVTKLTPPRDGESNFRLFSFLKDNSKDGCYFDLRPRQATNTVVVCDETILVSEEVVHGGGWLLTMPAIDSPPEEIRCIYRKVGDEPFIYSSGVGVWIAGKDGLVVRNINSPPFKEEMEGLIDTGDKRIMPLFWDLLENPREYPGQSQCGGYWGPVDLMILDSMR